MDQGLNTLKQEAALMKRFVYLKRSGFFLLLFAVSFVSVIILAILNVTSIITYAFFITFFSFIIGFAFMVMHIATNGKKEKAFNELLIKYLWQPLIIRHTFNYEHDYIISNQTTYNNKIITHPMISNRAVEEVTFQIKNTSKDLSLYALWYYTRSSNGQQTSTTTYFRGFAVETNVDVSGTLYVREDKWYQKLTAQFNSLSDYEKKDGLLINGNYTSQMERLRNDLLHLGFKDISLISQNNKLMILIHQQVMIPKMKKYNETTYQDHELFITKLIKAMEMTAHA